MNLLTYSLTVLVTYLGLIGGMIIAFATEEELKPGKKYFVTLQCICLAAIFGLLIYYFSINKLMTELIIGVVSFIILGIACYQCTIKKKKIEVRMPLVKSYLVYIVLAVIFYLSSSITGTYIIISSLIFVYGLPAGTRITDPKKKARSFWIVLSHLIYPIIAVGLKLSFL